MNDIERFVGLYFRMIGADGRILGYGRYTLVVKNKRFGDWLDSESVSKSEFEKNVPEAYDELSARNLIASKRRLSPE